MVSANDTITLHHLFVTPGVELLICWHLAGTEGCCRGPSALVSLSESIDTAWPSSSLFADLGEGWRGCVAVLHWGSAATAKWRHSLGSPLSFSPQRITLIYYILGVIFIVLTMISIGLVTLYSPNSLLRSWNMGTSLQCSPIGRETRDHLACYGDKTRSSQ